MDNLSLTCRKFQNRCTDCTLLNMAGIGIEDSGMKKLVDSCKQGTSGNSSYRTPIVCWWLENTCLSPGCAKDLSEMIRLSPRLKFLYLGCNMLGNAGAQAVAKDGLSQLQVCSLSANNIGPTGARHLATALRDPHCTIESLILDSNYLGDEGVVALVEGLKENKSLRTLELSYNYITTRGLVALRDVLVRHNTTLHHIRLEEDVDEDCLAKQPRGRKRLRPPPITLKNSMRVCRCNRCILQNEISYFLAMNRAGRHSIADLQLSTALWPRILAKSSYDDPSLLLSILRERPDVLAT